MSNGKGGVVNVEFCGDGWGFRDVITINKKWNKDACELELVFAMGRYRKAILANLEVKKIMARKDFIDPAEDL